MSIKVNDMGNLDGKMPDEKAKMAALIKFAPHARRKSPPTYIVRRIELPVVYLS
jgi:hypothetical protein